MIEASKSILVRHQILIEETASLQTFRLNFKCFKLVFYRKLGVFIQTTG